MDRKIIDASALLAYLFDETGSNMVTKVLEADSVLISSRELFRGRWEIT